MKNYKDFERFYLNYCLGFWSPARVSLSYGDFLVLHPDDDASMMYGVDLNLVKFNDLLADAQKFADVWSVPAGFYITPSWKGDVGGFKTFLAENGYHESHQMIPHILTNFNHVDDLPESEFNIVPTQDGDTVSDIFREVFECDKEMSDMVKNHLNQSNEKSYETQFFMAFDQKEYPVGIGGCCYDENFGYLNSLAVRKDYRGKKCAFHLVKARLSHLKKNNVPCAVTTVAWKNAPSLMTQKKIGYQEWIHASVWKSKNCQHQKEI